MTQSVSMEEVKKRAGRWVAGETVAEALEKAKELNSQGIWVTLNYLSEGTNEDGVRKNVVFYRELIASMKKHKIRGDVSVKLSQLGLGRLSHDMCSVNLDSIAAEAEYAGRYLNVDAEDKSTLDDAYAIIRMSNRTNLRPTFQVGLKRTRSDMESMNSVKYSARLCIGAYEKDFSLDKAKKEFVDITNILAFASDIKFNSPIILATNDLGILEQCLKFTEYTNPTGWVPASKPLRNKSFNFQLLYGESDEAKDWLKDRGLLERTSEYICFGENWLDYCRRRDSWFKRVRI